MTYTSIFTKVKLFLEAPPDKDVELLCYNLPIEWTSLTQSLTKNEFPKLPMFFVLLLKKTSNTKKLPENKKNTSGIPKGSLAFPSSPLGYPNLGALDNKPPKAPAAEEDITSVGEFGCATTNP